MDALIALLAVIGLIAVVLLIVVALYYFFDVLPSRIEHLEWRMDGLSSLIEKRKR